VLIVSFLLLGLLGWDILSSKLPEVPRDDVWGHENDWKSLFEENRYFKIGRENKEDLRREMKFVLS